jgi:autotransporter-associated beta strand protein
MNASVLRAKRENRNAGKGVLLAAVLMAMIETQAATPTYYWDTNGSDDGAGNPPTGDWYNTSTNWTLDPTGNSATFYYSNRANIVFCASDDPEWSDTYDYTVTVYGIEPVSDIQFKDGNCTLTTVVPYYLDKDTPFISVLNNDGSSAQTATLNSIIASAAGTTNGLDKYGPGGLVLGATNTYAGPTVIESGALYLGAPQVIPKTSMLVLAGGDTHPDDPYGATAATFQTGGFSQTLGPLLLTGPYTNLDHTIDFGHSASALVFADSHTQNWGGITLYLRNFKPGVDSLRFGTNSSGLTAAQLGLMNFYDSLNVPGSIDANGFVTPVAPPTLSVAPTGSNSMVLSWSAIKGRSYNVQFKTNLNDAYWLTNSIQDVVATTNLASFTDVIGTNSHGFYRILLRPVVINY